MTLQDRKCPNGRCAKTPGGCPPPGQAVGDWEEFGVPTCVGELVSGGAVSMLFMKQSEASACF